VLRLGEQPAYTYVPLPALRLMPRTSPTGETVYYQPPGGLGANLSYEDRVALARECLRRSGFERIAASRPIEIAFPPEPEQRLLAEAIQAMWESALGIPVVLRGLEGKVLSTRIRDLDYDVARSDWFGDYLDPSTFLGTFTTDSGQNRTGWSDAEYDRLITAAAAEPDDARRFALFRAAEQVLCEEELPIIPIFFRRGNYVLRPRFEGLHDNVRDLLQIHRARLAR
jgi:oligopeptide transport system substrate-binding protein